MILTVLRHSNVPHILKHNTVFEPYTILFPATPMTSAMIQPPLKHASSSFFISPRTKPSPFSVQVLQIYEQAASLEAPFAQVCCSPLLANSGHWCGGSRKHVLRELSLVASGWHRRGNEALVELIKARWRQLNNASVAPILQNLINNIGPS